MSENYGQQFPPVQQIPPVQPPRKKESSKKGCLICLTIILAILLVFVVCPFIFLCCICACLDDTSLSDYDSSKNVITKGSSSEIVAVVDIKGVITSSDSSYGVNSRRVSRLIEKLSEKSEISAIILDMDTPGGEVVAADEIHSAIKKCRDEHGIPVVTCMHSMGASGGYYIAAATDHIIANRMTFTGSIGVIMSSYNATGLIGKIGVEPMVFKSGDMKDMLSPTRELTDKEKQYTGKMVMETFAEFAKIVADGREAYETAEDVMGAEFADGRVLSGATAMELGLVDELGGFDAAVSKAKELSDAINPSIIHYSSKIPFWESIMSSKSSLLQPKSLISVDAPHLKAGQLYFMAPQAAIW